MIAAPWRSGWPNPRSCWSLRTMFCSIMRDAWGCSELAQRSGMWRQLFRLAGRASDSRVDELTIIAASSNDRAKVYRRAA